MTKSTLTLASASPRRRDILTALGLSFDIEPIAVDESRREGESGDDMVLRLARDKANAAASAGGVAGRIVIAADTAVVIDGAVLGKPVDREDGLAMLGRLSGREHDVVTGVAVAAGGRVNVALSRTAVRFREIGPDEASNYWHSGEPVDKAGGYAIQGLGGVFVESIRGSYTGVVGLPVFETASLLGDAGLPLPAAVEEQVGDE